MALWDHYVDYLIPDASPKTVNGTYNPVRAHIGRCKTDGLIDPLKFRQELLKVTTPIAGAANLDAAFSGLQVGDSTWVGAREPVRRHVSGAGYDKAIPTRRLSDGGATPHHCNL